MKDIYAGSTIFQAHFELRTVNPAKKPAFYGIFHFSWANNSKWA